MGLTMKTSNTFRELFSPIFTVWIKCRVHILFTFSFNVFPAAVTVQGFALMIMGHLGITIQTIQTQLLWTRVWWHWGEDQRCRRWDALRTGRNREGVQDRGTPEYLLLWGFDFPLSNLNVFPYPLCQRGKAWGRE